MRATRTPCHAGLIGLALGMVLSLSACGEVGPAADGPASAETEADIAAPARPGKTEMLAEFEAAMAEAQATSGSGAPAMWTFLDEDTTIHLFGTVHLLRPDLEWRTPAFESALSSADKVVFEVDLSSEEAQRKFSTDFFAKGIYENGRTLRAALNDQDEAAIEAAMTEQGMTLDAFNTLEPWMAASQIGVMKLMADGYDPTSGVESVIEAEARAGGKSFGYLETIAEQASAFDTLPEPAQIEYFYETVLLLEESPRMLDLLVEEWANGDIDGLGVLVASADGVGFSDEVYEALLVNRNRNWIPRIEALLDEPGTVLIAVGAGHLAGPDSVVKMLRDKGYEVTGP